MNQDTPSVSIVIPTHNRKQKLIRLLQSIKESDYPQEKIEVIIVDDASTDGTADSIRKLFPQVNIIRNREEKLPSTCRSLGIRNSRSNYVLLVDDDNVLDSFAIRELIGILHRNKSIGLVGPTALYLSDPTRIWCKGCNLKPPLYVPSFLSKGEIWKETAHRTLIECDYVPNAYMIAKHALSRVGNFDETLTIGWEETDLALRMKKNGYKVVVDNAAKVFHDIPKDVDIHTGGDRAYWRGRNRIIFYKKHSPTRRFLALLDVLGFAVLLSSQHKDFWKDLRRYINGIRDGIMLRVS